MANPLVVGFSILIILSFRQTDSDERSLNLTFGIGRKKNKMTKNKKPEGCPLVGDEIVNAMIYFAGAGAGALPPSLGALAAAAGLVMAKATRFSKSVLRR